MRTLIFVLVVTFCLCDFSEGQSQEVILFNMVRTAINKIELLSEQLQELRGESRKELRELRGNFQEKVRELRGEFRKELGELRGEFNALKSQMVGGCSKQDNMIQIFQGLIEMEVELGKDIVNQTCSATQLASLQDTFLTELEAVKQSAASDLQTLSSRMETDLKRSIETQTTTIQTEINALGESLQSCSSKEEIANLETLILKDECKDQSNNCSPKATCRDQLVGYKCQCLPGYSGDGLTCTALPCLPPSALINGLGCVTPFKEERKTWPEAQAYCLAQGSQSRLLEGISSQKEMDLLKEYFLDYFEFGYQYPWIGMRANPWRWVESGDPVDPSSSSSSSSSSSTLWMEGQPNDGDEGCGDICLSCSPPSLRDFPCSYGGYFLCQRI